MIVSSSKVSGEPGPADPLLLRGVAGIVAGQHALLTHLSANALCFLQKRELGDAASVPHTPLSRRGAGQRGTVFASVSRARARERGFALRVWTRVAPTSLDELVLAG
jgi:hypothetical protein